MGGDEFDDPEYKAIIKAAEQVVKEMEAREAKKKANKEKADELEKEIEKMEKDMLTKMDERGQRGNAHMDVYKTATAKITKLEAEMKRLRGSRGGRRTRRQRRAKRTGRPTKRRRAK